MCTTMVLMMRVTEMRIDHFLAFHLILGVLAIERDLRPLRVQLLLDDLKEILWAIRVPSTQVDT